LQCFLVSCLAYSSTLKMEATHSSKTSVDSQWATRRCIPEERNLHNRRRENLQSYNTSLPYVRSSKELGSWITRSIRSLRVLHFNFSIFACPPFQFFNQLTDVQEIWHELYSNGGHPKVVLFFLPFSFLNEKNTLTVFVCLGISSFGPVNRLSWNFLRTLCHQRPLKRPTC
jgi:hypothetical protein